MEGSFSGGETLRGIMSSSQMVDLVSFYFNFNFHFNFVLFSCFSILEHRVRVRSQDTKNKVEESRTNDVIQHGHYMLASCTTHGCLG